MFLLLSQQYDFQLALKMNLRVFKTLIEGKSGIANGLAASKETMPCSVRVSRLLTIQTAPPVPAKNIIQIVEEDKCRLYITS
jgi:hypothetical protein